MLYLRKARSSDVDLLYKWANDPAVRRNSFRSEPISYETHVDWFRRMMANESILQYILMENDEPVGQIRLSIENAEAEIGYSIAPEFRGRGYGHKILRLTAETVKKDHPGIKRLIAKVKPENAASNSLFVSEGYALDYMQYSLDIEIKN